MSQQERAFDVVIIGGGPGGYVAVVDAELKLNQLLSQINAENVHSEVDMGPAMGNEAW